LAENLGEDQKRTFSWWRNEVLYGGLIVIQGIFYSGCGNGTSGTDGISLFGQHVFANGVRNSAFVYSCLADEYRRLAVQLLLLCFQLMLQNVY
jgi:hypothetical protein